MQAHFDPPAWLEVLGWVSLAPAGAPAIIADIGLRGARQRMWIMHVV
ncbi:hypothetical protein OIE43_44000 [Streptomyces pseudovenezuelae]|uniref:Uncharacterized protein n=1 Tax=Streptomyces pseudovenezuelae TaxID=67350 RepID=A0ABZ1XBS2_9ACTN|nr:hypothetical protein [Streptomyces pseudovenezuelae]